MSRPTESTVQVSDDLPGRPGCDASGANAGSADPVAVRDLINRLRGRYARGPILADGEPEFGWSVFTEMPNGGALPAIHGEAADALESLLAAITQAEA